MKMIADIFSSGRTNEAALLFNKTAEQKYQRALKEIARLRQQLETTSEKLELTQQRFNQVELAGKIGHWDFDFTTFKSSWSEGSYRILGIEPGDETPSQESFLKFVHPADRAHVMQAMQHGEKNFEPFTFYHRLVRRNGEEIHAFSRAIFEFDKSGKPVRLYGILADISEVESERRKLQQANDDLSMLESENQVIRQLNEEIKSKNTELRRKNKDVIDSINYAKYIQNAILSTESGVRMHFPESFVLSKPKDIVSGDFYWTETIGSKTFIAVVDCTGHGVPGALMSIVGHNLLNKLIREQGHSMPASILNQLSRELCATLKTTSNDDEQIIAGMDISLCMIDRERGMIEYAGAYNSLYILHNGVLQELPADHWPVGMSTDKNHGFTNYRQRLEPGDTFYLFSDGYADQFGGERGKKFMYNKFQLLLRSIHHLPMEAQKEILDQTIRDWQGSEQEQTDDILVVGFRI